MKNICLIGAGQLGSRHLQAFKAVSSPLNITVVDPFPASLKLAQERYEAASGSGNHPVRYISRFEELSDTYDIAIVATNSDVRRSVIEELLTRASVRYLILEKILFQKKEDYSVIGDLLKNKSCRAWIDCSMRTMPFYYDLKNKVHPPLVYFVTGSHYGLISTAIHYIDHIAHLTDCYDYTLLTDGLDPNPIPSKRPGFLEMSGTLAVHFKDGSLGSFTYFPEGTAPIHVEIHDAHGRVISRENEQKSFLANAETQWLWQESDAPIPFQSQMTTTVIEDLLTTGRCLLTPYEQSVKLHLPLLDGLAAFLEKHGQNTDLYPFT